MKKSLWIGVLACLGFVAAPGIARAITVECSNPDGMCQVSNDGGIDNVECSCVDIGFGTTGGNVWAGLNEMELMLVCEMELATCGQFGTTTTIGATVDTGDPTMTSFGVTTDGPTTSPTSGPGSTTDTDSTTGPGDTTGSVAGSSSSSSTGLDPTIDPPGTSTGDDDPSTSGASMSAGSMTGAGTTGGGSTGDGSGQANTDSGGCGCSAARPAPGWALIGLVGLFALRRRE